VFNTVRLQPRKTNPAGSSLKDLARPSNNTLLLSPEFNRLSFTTPHRSRPPVLLTKPHCCIVIYGVLASNNKRLLAFINSKKGWMMVDTDR
jgi:hypothetical protein